MSEIVGGWMDELAKLRERVAARKPVLPRAEKDQRFVKEGHVEEKEAGRDCTKDSTMSETTVFLLIDRFVPW